MSPLRSFSFSVRLADFASSADAAAALEIRRVVFIEEQAVPTSLEIDGRDPDCVHVLAFAEAGEPIGTARLLPEGKIGRVAVLAPWRRRGVGAALMRALMETAAGRGFGSVALHAQSWTVGFYVRLGFVAEGEEFTEAEIPHRRMVWRRDGI